MEPWMVLSLAGVAGFGLAFVATNRGSGRSRAFAHARKTGDVALVVEVLEQSAGPKQEVAATEWDQAITELWNAYAREAAARLIMEASKRSQADIIQYWLRQIMEVEPDIAREVMTVEFLEAHFDPQRASQCGRKGCCG